MAKTRTIALADHYAQGSTTIARCWKATRKDGFVLAVTTCARDLLFEGVLYRSAEGFIPKAISQEASAAVANTEVEGALSDDINELEFEAGLWDGATVEVFEVNYRALSMGKMLLGVATMGDIKCTRSAFNAELRGLTQSLQMTTGRTVQPTCDYKFGDPNTCRKDLAPLTVAGALTGVTDRRTVIDTARTELADWFGGGLLTLNGESQEIYSFNAGVFVTHLPFTTNPQPGDSYTAVPGCRKRWNEDCKGKWANGPNFGGFPDVPGPDTVLGMSGTEGTHL